MRPCRILIAGFLIIASTPSYSKCVSRAIHVDGVIAGPLLDGEKVIVVVTPDPNTTEGTEAAIKDHSFSGTTYFDSTKAEGRVRDDCSRMPETVEVELVIGDRIVDKVILSASKNFIIDKAGDFRLKSTITLHSAESAQTTRGNSGTDGTFSAISMAVN